jgi:hypothetical protein
MKKEQLSREQQRKLYRAWKKRLQGTKLSEEEATRRAKSFAKKGMTVDEQEKL